MTDSTIGVAEPGTPTKLLQSYQNTVSSQTVQAEGVVQVDLNGVPVPRGTLADPVFSKITDGTNTPSIKNTVPGGFDYGLSVRQIGAISANQGTNNSLSPWYVQTVAGVPIGIGALDTGVTKAINSIADISGNEMLFVVVEGNQGILQQEVSTQELQVVQHVGSTGIDPRQTRALLATDQPDITVSHAGTLPTSNDEQRRSQERVIMLAEIDALNSLIHSENGPGARNYQELR
jgi:hypothetical protein